MSSTPGDMQIQTRLDKAVSLLEEIRADRRTDRLFDAMEIARDHISGLSRGHDSIRREIREIANLVIQQQSAD